MGYKMGYNGILEAGAAAQRPPGIIVYDSGERGEVLKRLVHMPGGATIFVVFVLLMSLARELGCDGRLVSLGEPLTVAEAARRIGMNVLDVVTALDVLERMGLVCRSVNDCGREVIALGDYYTQQDAEWQQSVAVAADEEIRRLGREKVKMEAAAPLDGGAQAAMPTPTEAEVGSTDTVYAYGPHVMVSLHDMK